MDHRGTCRPRFLSATLVLLAVCLAGRPSAAIPVAAPGRPEKAEPELWIEKISLNYLKPEGAARFLLLDLVKLRTSDQAASAYIKPSTEALVPLGIVQIRLFPQDDSLLVRGMPDAIETLKHAIQIGDVPVTSRGKRQASVTLTEVRALPQRLLETLLRSSHPGQVRLTGSGLQLTGDKEWVRSSMIEILRRAIQPATSAAPSSGEHER